MKRSIAAAAALIAALTFGASPTLARDFVNDGASMFGADTVAGLDSRIGNFNAQTGKEIVVVTVPSLPQGQSVKDAAEREFAQRQVNGVLIYVAKDDRKDIFVPDNAGVRAGWFSSGTLDPIRQNMESQFKDGNFDAGITSAVSGVLGIYRAHAGSLHRGAYGNSVPVSQNRPYSNAASSGGFHISMFWLIIILIAAFLVVRSLIRAMSAPRPPMMQGGPGAPGYGQGYGYGPGGYGGGGGSFFSGLLGGLGGAFLGNELFGNRGGGIAGGESQGSFGDGGTGGSQDAGGWASDAGQADMGGSSGGDWSGGGFGGGDSGGGFGGGGDSGGGW